MKSHLILFTGVLFALNIQSQTFPYQNPRLSSEERAQDLVLRLTLEEKAILMCDISEAVPRLGIKKFNWWSEALHGYARNSDVTVFPEPIGMAASFDDSLLFKIFTAVSDEARAKYNGWMKMGNENQRFISLSVWTPNINIFRDPRWGRGQETYGEDPYLMARMGISVVKGLQGPEESKYKKLLACAKHYAVHSGPESTRHTMNVIDVSARDLYETYLPAFKALVQEADVRQVMCAYQRLDDDPCCGSERLLQRILREDWGYEHLVVSDCGAIADFYQNHKVSSDPAHAAANASLAGTDIECGFGYAYKDLPDAVAMGLIRESDINQNVLRVLKGRFDLGEMDDDSLVPWTKIPESIINCEAHKTLALQMARETMTLLQNKHDLLPLNPSIQKIAVVGPNADNERMMWGNYNGIPFNTITILEGIRSKLPEEKIYYEKGCDLTDKMYVVNVFEACSMDGQAGIKATYWNSRDFSGEVAATEQMIRPIRLTTDGQHEFASGVQLQGFSGIYETVYTAPESKEMLFKIEPRGLFELIVNGDTLYKPVPFGPRTLRIPLIVEKDQTYHIEARFRQIGNWPASLNLDFGYEVPVAFETLIENLKGINTVIFAGGISSELEGEEMPVDIPGFKGGDRTDMELPAIQRECLKALKQAGKKIVFVDCSGSAMGLVPEIQSCDAILQAWYGGEAGGQAVADVLFGDYNPSGKLPVTFYKSIDQLSDFEDYSMKGRTYRYMDDALFPFGFGLSYTRFSIGKAKLSQSSIQQGEGVSLTIPVSNKGKRDGAEVVQIYVRKMDDIDGPLKTLKQFKRIMIPAGKTCQVTLDLPSSAFEFFDSKTLTMAVTPSMYELFYGNSSDDRDLERVEVEIR